MKMKHIFVWCSSFFLFDYASYAQDTATPGFEAGDNGYESYRIPTIIKSPSGDLLAFSNAADTVYRKNLTLRISQDGGKTWKKSFLVDKKDAGTMYSDIVKVSEKKEGMFYERKGYSQLVFKTI